MKRMIPDIIKRRVAKTKEWITQQIIELDSNPLTVDEFVKLVQAYDYTNEEYDGKRESLTLSEDLWKICEDFGFPTGEDKQSRFLEDVFQLINKLKQIMYTCKERSDKKRDEMKIKVKKEVPMLHSRVEAIDERINDSRYLEIDLDNIEDNINLMIETIKEVQTEFDDIHQMKYKVQNYQKTLEMGKIESFNNVEDSKITLDQRSKLWNSIFSWRQNTKIWQESIFEDIDVQFISQEAQKQTKIVLQCERNLPEGSSAVVYLKKLVFDFKEAMPIVEALNNSNLMEEHWIEIKAVMKQEDYPLEEKKFTLGELV